MLDLTMKIEAVNVPPDLQHKTRPIEIEELPKFLQVNVAGSGTKSVINFGAQAPSPEDSKYPWLKLNANGSAAGWYVMVNGVWTVVGGQGKIPPDHPLSANPPGIVDIASAAPYLPVVTLSGGIPPYSFSADLGGGGTMNVPPVMAGLNNELIYPVGLVTTAGLHTLVFTDSENSSLLSITFRIDAGAGVPVICTPTKPILSIGTGTVDGVLSGGTPPYYILAHEKNGGIQYFLNVVQSVPGTLTFTPTALASSFLGYSTWVDVVDATGFNTLRLYVLIAE